MHTFSFIFDMGGNSFLVVGGEYAQVWRVGTWVFPLGIVVRGWGKF
jgi:hypothetical protein